MKQSERYTMAIAIFLITTITFSYMKAQDFVPGEYQLRGVREMASAFLFTPDGKFQFMYVYGASDRNATGTYTVDGDTLRLKSDKEPGKDFDVLKSSRRKDLDGILLQVKEQNTYLASTVMSTYVIDGQYYEVEADAKGKIWLPVTECDEVYVHHLVYPDYPTLIRDKSNTDNYFELKLKPSLEQVSFKGIDFAIKDSTITCLPNYFFPMENVAFQKIGNE